MSTKNQRLIRIEWHLFVQTLTNIENLQSYPQWNRIAPQLSPAPNPEAAIKSPV